MGALTWCSLPSKMQRMRLSPLLLWVSSRLDLRMNPQSALLAPARSWHVQTAPGLPSGQAVLPTCAMMC